MPFGLRNLLHSMGYETANIHLSSPIQHDFLDEGKVKKLGDSEQIPELQNLLTVPLIHCPLISLPTL